MATINHTSSHLADILADDAKFAGTRTVRVAQNEHEDLYARAQSFAHRCDSWEDITDECLLDLLMEDETLADLSPLECELVARLGARIVLHQDAGEA